jgi:hypothetical protein
VKPNATLKAASAVNRRQNTSRAPVAPAIYTPEIISLSADFNGHASMHQSNRILRDAGLFVDQTDKSPYR